MENLVTRHRSLAILAGVLFLQILGLAVQVKRSGDDGSTRLIRLWAVRLVTPVQEAVVHTSNWADNLWHDYVDLRGIRGENAELREEIRQLNLERVRMAEDASQARRLQALLGFKEQYISETLPAQVISTTGTDFSRGIYIDKGTNDGVQRDMPVISPRGVIGKVFRVYPSSSLVLLINDPTSGAGVILEKSRLQGILKGTSSGETVLQNVMSDEKVQVGENVLTSGGDRVFPKGLPVGTVVEVAPGQDIFLRVRIKPAARLDRLEEVLVLTKIEERGPSIDDITGPIRAADILSQRLPSVPTVSEGSKVLDPATGMPSPTRNLPSVAPAQTNPAIPPSSPATRAQGAASSPGVAPGAPREAAAGNPSASPSSAPQDSSR